jgi:hypothetical protein
MDQDVDQAKVARRMAWLVMILNQVSTWSIPAIAEG